MNIRAGCIGRRVYEASCDRDGSAHGIEAVAWDGKRISLGRRSLLRGALGGVAGVVSGARMSGASPSAPRQVDATPGSTTPESAGSKVLLVYFSRAGEKYYYGGRKDLKVGNTEVLAGMISRRIGCDVYGIEPVDPYPDDYDETVERNVREQDADARPAIANPLDSINDYDIVLLGSPISTSREDRRPVHDVRNERLGHDGA